MMRKWFELVRKDKMYLSIVLALSCSLFVLGYQYIHRVNQVEPEPLPTAEKPPALVVEKTYASDDLLLDVKMGRDRERSREIERIETIINQVDVSDELRKEAERELWRLTQAVSKENELESVLKANGFEDCLVTVGQKNVTVVVSGKLTPEDVRLLGESSADVTGFSLEKIRIVEQGETRKN